MAYKKSSDELRKKPSKNRSKSNKYIPKNSAKAVNQKVKDRVNEIYSHSTEKSFDLSSMGNKAKNKKSKKALVLSNVILSLVLVISIIAFSVTALMDVKIMKNEDIDAQENGDFEKIISSLDERVAYFLICGVDLSENLTDIIMVGCYDLANNEMNVLQIPRDTFVGDVPTGKINAVYGNPRDGESKIKALIRCINAKFGIPIDHYATVTISGTEKIIDIMGGIDIKLDRSFTLVDDSRKPEQRQTFSAGKVHLDGQWATAFLRHRKSFDQGDLGRIKNQRSVYAAILKKLTSISFSEVANIVTDCMNDVSTDLPLGLALGYAEKANKLNLKKVKFYSLPGQSATISGLSCWVCHKQETVDLINKYFMPYEENLLTVDDLSIKDYTEIGANYDNSYGSFLEGGELEKFDKDQN